MEQRDVKFRAWDCYRGLMSDPFGVWQSRLNHDGKPMGIQRAEDLRVIQFTGLKDRNDVEIYEGYICNVKEFHHIDPSGKWKTCEVIWGCEHGWAYRGYYVGRGAGDFYGIRATAVCEVEVIGNIYADPALLTNN